MMDGVDAVSNCEYKMIKNAIVAFSLFSLVACSSQVSSPVEPIVVKPGKLGVVYEFMDRDLVLGSCGKSYNAQLRSLKGEWHEINENGWAYGVLLNSNVHVKLYVDTNQHTVSVSRSREELDVEVKMFDGHFEVVTNTADLVVWRLSE